VPDRNNLDDAGRSSHLAVPGPVACVGLILAAVPLAFAPGLLLHYDVTPKLIALSVGAAAMVFLAAPALKRLFGQNRWLLLLIGLQALSLTVSTVFSSLPEGSIGGALWRRFGLVAQASLLLFLVVALDVLSRWPRARLLLLRASAATACLIGIYGVCQYLEVDPFIRRQLYSIGRFGLTLLRPPGTTGSAPALGNYEMAAFFFAWALSREERARAWKWLGPATAAVALAAVVLSGTRASLLGIAAGVAVLLARGMRPRRGRLLLPSIAVAAVLFGGLLLSPAGLYLRNRAIQAWGDWKGGTRISLWHDCLPMFLRRPLAGYGLDTFAREFPAFESAALANEYPDTYNESPHNFLVDAAVGQGMPGLILVLGLLGAALSSGVRKRPGHSAEPVLAGVVALAVAHQFFVFEITTGLVYCFGIALLLAVEATSQAAPEPRCGPLARICQAWVAALLLWFAGEAAWSGHRFQKVAEDLGAGRLAASVRDYEMGRKWSPPGFQASLWYSRTLLAAAQARNQVPAMMPAILDSARDAFQGGEDRHNACHHLAILYVRQGNRERARALLKEGVKLAPNWYLPYSSLGLVLASLGETGEAQTALLRAVALSGKHRAEMLRQLDSVRAFPGVQH
jgi:O-antigen ligase